MSKEQSTPEKSPGPGGETSPPPTNTPDETEDELRARTLAALEDYADACANEAILARKAADDAAIAFRSGAAIPAHSVLELKRPQPGGGFATPAVISTGSARIVVTTERSHAGLRAPGGYYKHYVDKLDAAAKHVRVRRVFEPMHTYGRPGSATAGDPAADSEKDVDSKMQGDSKKHGDSKKDADSDEDPTPSTSGVQHSSEPSHTSLPAKSRPRVLPTGGLPSRSSEAASGTDTPRTPPVSSRPKKG